MIFSRVMIGLSSRRGSYSLLVVPRIPLFVTRQVLSVTSGEVRSKSNKSFSPSHPTTSTLSFDVQWGFSLSRTENLSRFHLPLEPGVLWQTCLKRNKNDFQIVKFFLQDLKVGDPLWHIKAFKKKRLRSWKIYDFRFSYISRTEWSESPPLTKTSSYKPFRTLLASSLEMSAEVKWWRIVAFKRKGLGFNKKGAGLWQV